MKSDVDDISTLDEARREIARLRSIVDGMPDAPAATPGEKTSVAKTALYHLYNDLLLSHTPNMIFLFNEELEYVIGSSACRKLTRQERVNLAHRPLPLLFCKEVDGGWVEKISRLNQEVLATRQSTMFRDTIDIEGEETIHVNITISPMIDDRGRNRGTIMAINDITELMETQRQAEEAARSKASFLANMSHEIRTPMNAIKGLSELLTMTALNDTQRNYVKNIVASSKSLIGVINDVLDFSKIDANRIEIVPAPYSLHKMVSDLCGSIGLRAEEKGLLMLLEIDPTLPSRLVGDDNRIKQVLLNLLSNAVKYTKNGHIVLRIAGTPLPSAEIKLKFMVEDTGIGVKSEDMPLLFNAFSRVDLKANRSIQGTGLGLAISKHLSEIMNGSISLQSVYGQGSTFIFSLPQKVDDPSPLAVAEEADECAALLIGTGLCVMNLAATLRRLGVRHAVFPGVESDVELARKLSEPGFLLPEIDGRPAEFTHCIYTRVVPERAVAGLRERLGNCRFALLRSLIDSSERNAGTNTVLFNPLLVTELAKFLNKSGRASSHRDASSDTAVSRKLRVRDAVALVIDDNRINLMVCEKMLNVLGMKVRTASGGREALEAAERERFDIIFVDHMMPEMDGVEVTAELRSRPGPNSRTPIVALTANVVNDMRSYYLKCGMDDFVSKPIDRADMARVLMQWLPAHKLSENAVKGIG